MEQNYVMFPPTLSNNAIRLSVCLSVCPISLAHKTVHKGYYRTNGYYKIRNRERECATNYSKKNTIILFFLWHYRRTIARHFAKSGPAMQSAFWHQTITASQCWLRKLLPYILFDKYKFYILALEMASPGNQYCANCIGTLSFPIHWWAGLYASRYRAEPRTTIFSTTFARRRNRYALVIFTTRKHSLGGCTMDRATGAKTVTGWAHIVSPISGTIPTVLHCGCSYARRRTDQCWFQALFLDGECPLPKKTYNYPFTPSGCQIVCSKFFFRPWRWIIQIQGGPKKPDCFSDLITLWRLVLERRAVCQNFLNFIEKKVHNSHFSEFKYSLPNLLKSSHQLKLCYIWPEHIDFTQFTLTYSETTVIFPQS